MPDPLQLTDEKGNPLGFCHSCFRMRWLGKVIVPDLLCPGRPRVPEGVCTQCLREAAADSPAS